VSAGVERRILAGLAAGLLALLAVGPAAGHHYIYYAEEDLTRVYAVKQWAINGSYLRWCSDNNAFYGSVIEVWEQVLPGQQWAEDCGAPDVRIQSDYSGYRCESWQAACLRLDREEYDTDRQSEYVVGASIWLNEGLYDFTSDWRVAAVAHEVGHVYGLHDRYDDVNHTFWCNAGDNSIMEGLVGQGVTVTGGCDSNVPTSTDIGRVQAFYDVAPAGSPTMNQIAAGSVDWCWTDVNWAESGYQVSYYWWDGAGWAWKRTDLHISGVGPGRPTNPSTLCRRFDLPADWPSGTYTSCIETRNEVYGTKHWVCTPFANLQPCGPPGNLPDGALIRGETGTRVYVIYGGAKFWIHTPQDFEATGFSWNNVQCVPDSVVSSIPDVPPDKTLVREFGTAPVYVMACEARFWVPDEATLNMMLANGYANPPVYVVPPGEAARLSVQPDEWCNLKEVSRQEQYVVCQGYKWHIFSMFALQRIGLGNSPPRVLWDGALSGYPTTSTLDRCLDTDGDGYSDTAERYVGTALVYPCGNDGWPADLAGGGNKLDITDVLSYVAPVNRIGTGPGDANYSVRWDLVPSPKIDVTDLLSLITVAPPMLGGQRAFGKTCPYPP